MEALVRLIKEECEMSRLGGRVHVIDNMRTCLVYDVLQFDKHVMTRLFARAYVEVISDTTSLSGYVMRLTLRPHKVSKVLAVTCLLACLCAIFVHCLKRDI